MYTNVLYEKEEIDSILPLEYDKINIEIGDEVSLHNGGIITKTEDGVFYLSSKLLEALKRTEQQIRNGEIIPAEKLYKELEEEFEL